MKFSKWPLLLIGSFLLSGACSSDSNEPDTDETTVSISTPSVTNVTDDKANIIATITTKDRKSTRLNSSHVSESRMPSSA